MATDARAVMVAARENATSEKNISDLQTILNDLMLNTKISESSKLAHEVQRGMMGNLRKRYKYVKNLGVKQAPFYILIGAEMPAVLVETGFITNPRERGRLLNKRYLERIAEGIAGFLAGGDLNGVPTLIVTGRSDAILPPNHTSRAYVGLNRVVEGASSRLSYVEVLNAQHLDRETLENTLTVLLKYESDAQQARRVMRRSMGEDGDARAYG